MLKVPSELLCKTDYFRPLLREIGEGILPDEVRLHEQKYDPVYGRGWMSCTRVQPYIHGRSRCMES